jgi:hypothetical protein
MTNEGRKTRKIESLDDVPSSFASEAEEALFWETHPLGDGLLSDLRRPTDPRLPPIRQEPAQIGLHHRREPGASRRTLKAAKQVSKSGARRPKEAR